MPRRASILNVRGQLQYAQVIMEGLQKYGMSPALEVEIRKFLIINKAILRKADEARAKNNRHDLYVGKK